MPYVVRLIYNVLMHAIQVLPTLITILALAFMGFLVIRNSRDKANGMFMAFVLVDSTWLLSVFAVNYTVWGSSEYLGRFTFAMSVALLISVQAFINALLNFKHSSIYNVLVYGLGFVVFGVTLCTDFVISGVRIDQVADKLSPFPVYGRLYPIFIAYLAGGILAYILMLLRRESILERVKDITGRQLDLVTVGMVGFIVASLLTNLVLPTMFSDPWPSQFAPVGSLFLAIFFFYAITRHRLFDIRIAVVRSTIYLFLAGGLMLAYAASVNVINSFLSTSGSNEAASNALNAVVVLAIAVSFAPLKRLFDKVTGKYFFRDLYDTQEVVDKLNSILISSSDARAMLSSCEGILVDRLRLEFCFFGISTEGSEPRVFVLKNESITGKDYRYISKQILLSNEKMIIRGMPAVVRQRELQSFLERKRISAITRMTSHDDEIGFIVFGDKKSGGPISGQDIRLLSIASDQIAIAIQNSLRFEKIQNFNKTLKEEVERATRQLRYANQKLRKMDEVKDDFIGMASHQLRTPLTAVRGYASMLLDGDAGELTRAQRKMIKTTFISAHRMVYLIADMLNVSRLHTGKFIIESIPSNLADVVKSEVEQLVEMAKPREINLEYAKPKKFPTYMLDEAKIRQVIMNLIDNAIYYSPRGAAVTINLVEKPQSIEFTVVDRGIGVPKAEQHNLFSKYFRAHNAKRARPDGTGLGLFMAKKVIIAHGGAMIFKSQEGKGSTFGFTLAKSKLQVPDEPGSSTPDGQMANVAGQVPASKTDKQASRPLAKARITKVRAAR